MIPTQTNTADQGCVPMSSNCIIWQGPDLTCINLCRGDSISDVTYKLAEKLCTLITELDVTDLELGCVFEHCATCDDPSFTIAAVLQAMITKICLIDEIVSGGEEPVVDGDIILTIAECFRENDINGDPILTLEHSVYTREIGLKVCEILDIVNQHTDTLDDHEDRITALEVPGADPATPQITPNCVLPAVPTDIDTVLDELESQFCLLRTATGTPTDLSQAVGKQCVSLSSADVLTGSGSMSGISGWKNSPTSLADTVNNLWLTLCDIRSAVVAVKACCDRGCEAVTIDFGATISSDGALASLFFPGYSVIPSGYEDCTEAGSKLTITDSDGNIFVTYVPVVLAAADPAAFEIDLSATSLNGAGQYLFTMEACVTNGTHTCTKIFYKTYNVGHGTAPASCELPTGITATITSS